MRERIIEAKNSEYVQRKKECLCKTFLESGALEPWEPLVVADGDPNDLVDLRRDPRNPERILGNSKPGQDVVVLDESYFHQQMHSGWSWFVAVDGNEREGRSGGQGPTPAPRRRGEGAVARVPGRYEAVGRYDMLRAPLNLAQGSLLAPNHSGLSAIECV